MSRNLTFDKEALHRMYYGVQLLAKAVKVTLGPKGRNVLLPRAYGSPHVTKDGVSVAKEVSDSDPIINMAMELVKEAANNTLENAGDGTTSTTTLTEAIFKYAKEYLTKEENSLWDEFLHLISPSNYPLSKFGSNSMDLKRGIDLASKSVIDLLKKMSKEVSSSNDIYNIAKISSNNDQEIGGLIKLAIDKVGNEGVIQTEDSKDFNSHMELIKGLQLDRGYFSKDFLDDSSHSIIEYDNPRFFMYDGTISAMQDLIRAVEITIQSEIPLIIIAEDLHPTVVRFLLTNKVRSGSKIAVIKTPGMGNQKLEILKDLAALTGCNTLDPIISKNLSSLKLIDLGSATSIKITKSTTTIISNNKFESLVDLRIRDLRKELLECELDSMALKLEKRIAQLRGKLAIIYIGAFTEVELKEKKDRLEDALAATKAAIQEGIVPGGGLALLRISQDLEKIKFSENKNIMLGAKAVLKAIREPFIAILDNAGLDSHSIMKEVLENENPNYGYDSYLEHFTDLLKAGIMDPVKVTRLAVQNSSSVAGMFITTGCIISKTE